jgi:hypothetical protein
MVRVEELGQGLGRVGVEVLGWFGDGRRGGGAGEVLVEDRQEEGDDDGI